jgi:hypothetical protein
MKHIWWGADSVNLMRLYKELTRSRMEYSVFLLHKLEKKQLQKLGKIGQYAEHWATGVAPRPI